LLTVYILSETHSLKAMNTTDCCNFFLHQRRTYILTGGGGEGLGNFKIPLNMIKIQYKNIARRQIGKYSYVCLSVAMANKGLQIFIL